MVFVRESVFRLEQFEQHVMRHGVEGFHTVRILTLPWSCRISMGCCLAAIAFESPLLLAKGQLRKHMRFSFLTSEGGGVGAGSRRHSLGRLIHPR